ncbi:hypothetical protein AB6A40_000179 [Gnathostoma spinigerum]|uniref:Phosphatidylinositol transfer protein N-terminal domain-containing protein n=1 Tax=Gnathostoma spinigerum TaxID=75299 RepID=A0ABD6EAZ0_9BILA
MLLKEYRVLLPLEVSEYERGQLYAVAETSKNETGGGDGVEVIRQMPFTSDSLRPGETLRGTYTEKIYHTKSKAPWIFRKFLPDSAFALQEESWNAYPYIKTVITNPDYLGERFFITVTSMHLNDNGGTENALNLTEKELEQREVIILNIYDDDNLKPSEISDETNPRIFTSKRTGRGPLEEGWEKTTTPVMCCYKVVSLQIRIFGLQTIMERIMHQQYPRIFTKFNRETFCWIDNWYDMTMDDIRSLEDETKNELKERIADDEKRGIVCDVGEDVKV